MAHESVSIRNDRLLLEGQPLSLERHTPDDLAYVLRSLGREAITSTIESLYTKTVEANPGATVERPSLYALDLGKNKKRILAAFGQRNRTQLHRSIVEVRPEVREYWEVIQDASYSPEIRSGMGSRKNPQNWLQLRNPETDPPRITPLDHLPVALGFIQPDVTNELKPQLREAWTTGDTDTYRTLRTEYLDASYGSLDRQRESFDDPLAYEYAGIGQIVADANLRAEIEGDGYLLDPDGYEAALEDAEMAAYQHYDEDLDAVLQAEIKRVRALRSKKLG